MNRKRFFTGIFAAALMLLGSGVSDVFAQKANSPLHRLAIQVDSDSSDTMNLAINNAMSVKRYYDGQHEKVSIEIVTYGPGITMLRGDTSRSKIVSRCCSRPFQTSR